MATTNAPFVPIGDGPDSGDAAVQRTWRSKAAMSSIATVLEGFLGRSGFDRGPWLAVAFALGIGTWFILDEPWQWIAAIGAALLVAIAAGSLRPDAQNWPELRRAAIAVCLLVAFGIATVWTRSEIVGAEPIPYP